MEYAVELQVYVKDNKGQNSLYVYELYDIESAEQMFNNCLKNPANISVRLQQAIILKHSRLK